MPNPVLRRALITAGAAATALAVVGCGAKQDATTTSAAPGTTAATAGAPPGTVAGSGTTGGTGVAGGTPGSTAGKGTAGGGDCPAATTITVHAEGGDKTLKATTAKAAVTLDSTLQMSFANFDVPDAKVTSIAAPTPTGDQLYASVYLSATKGAVEPGTYTSVSDELGPLQLNTHDVYDASGRLYFSGFGDVKEKVTITKVDKASKKVCGTITTQLFDGPFTADIISWSS